VKTEIALYDRGVETLVAAWIEHARGSTDAAVHCFPGVDVAVFPSGAEREFHDNAVLDRGLGAAGCVGAVDAVEWAYAAAGIDRYAVWVHESDTAGARHLERRG
jgi:hypothetical protein